MRTTSSRSPTHGRRRTMRLSKSSASKSASALDLSGLEPHEEIPTTPKLDESADDTKKKQPKRFFARRRVPEAEDDAEHARITSLITRDKWHLDHGPSLGVCACRRPGCALRRRAPVPSMDNSNVAVVVARARVACAPQSEDGRTAAAAARRAPGPCLRVPRVQGRRCQGLHLPWRNQGARGRRRRRTHRRRRTAPVPRLRTEWHRHRLHGAPRRHAPHCARPALRTLPPSHRHAHHACAAPVHWRHARARGGRRPA